MPIKTEDDLNRSLFAPLPAETRCLLDGICALIDRTFPLPGRFRSTLPENVAELSRLLTSGRNERGLSYLGQPALLSAYLRYFLPWNLYRLCRLLSGLDITLAENDVVTDLGCGPFTFAAALWICRPCLRTVPLEFYCIDRSGPALEAGKKFFAALTGGTSPWKIHAIKGDIANHRTANYKFDGSQFDTGKKKQTALVCAVNVFNEMYGDISRSETSTIQRSAEKSIRILESYATASASVLIAEPGFPRCGELISHMRNVLLERGCRIVSPCPHDAACPFPGTGTQKKHGKERWCHFAFETMDAPAALHKLSRAAGLPKERAVLSFLFAGSKNIEQTVSSRTNTAPATSPCETTVRVISDSFPLPHNRYGRYCCSQHGLVLLTGEKNTIEKTVSGMLVNVIIEKSRTDPKSGALTAELH